MDYPKFKAGQIHCTNLACIGFIKLDDFFFKITQFKMGSYSLSESLTTYCGSITNLPCCHGGMLPWRFIPSENVILVNNKKMLYYFFVIHRFSHTHKILLNE
jgi:hypothetical protein